MLISKLDTNNIDQKIIEFEKKYKISLLGQYRNQEWDVNNKQPNQHRDGERFVTGSDGSIYYTDSHYGEGTSLNGIPDFVKIR